MTYTAVNAIVTDRDEKTMEEYADFVDMFDLMKDYGGHPAGRSISAVPSILISRSPRSFWMKRDVRWRY